MRRLVIIFSVFLLSSCASTTIINSEPQGAQVLLNGEVVGSTPYTHTDRKMIGSTTTVLLKKEGYEDYKTLMVRNEEFDAAACAGGVFTLVPFLWVQKYHPTRTDEMTSLEEETVETAPVATPVPLPTVAPVLSGPSEPTKIKMKPAAQKPAKKPRQ